MNAIAALLDLVAASNESAAEWRASFTKALADGQITICGRPCRVTLEWEDDDGGPSPVEVLRRVRFGVSR